MTNTCAYEENRDNRNRLLSYFFILFGVPGVFLTIYWTAYIAPKRSCPPSADFSGSVDGQGLAALLVIGLCLSVLGMGYWTGPSSKYSPEQLIVQKRRLRKAGWIFILPSLAWWLPNSQAYYCASSNGIEYNSGLFTQPRLYSWNQVSKILPHCASGKGAGVGISIYLPEKLKLELWNSPSDPIETNVEKIFNFLKGTNFQYDLSFASRECPSDWKKYFSSVPSVEGVR